MPLQSSLQNQFSDCLQDPLIEDISVTSTRGLMFYKLGSWHHESRNELEDCDQFARDLAHLIAETAGVTLCKRHPSLDTELNSFGGVSTFRAHVVIPPLSGSGIQITLRRLETEKRPIPLQDFGFDETDLASAVQAIQNKDSILICGPTGSGKTSLLRSLLERCDKNERVAVLEDSAEITAPTFYSFCLRSRQNRFSSVEGSTWSLEQLVYESLRMRPDRIVLGECRGPEALGLLHAMQSGHRGVMCTLHASNELQAQERFENLIQLAASTPLKISSTIWDHIIVLSIDKQGKRHARLVAQNAERKNA
jgi:pilus assembly protein CpaF